MIYLGYLTVILFLLLSVLSGMKQPNEQRKDNPGDLKLPHPFSLCEQMEQPDHFPEDVEGVFQQNREYLTLADLNVFRYYFEAEASAPRTCGLCVRARTVSYLL